MSLPNQFGYAAFHLMFKHPAIFAIGALSLVVYSFIPEDKSRPMVAFTFDDGYSSVLDVAMPILQEKDMIATAYITTSVLGENPRYLLKEDLFELVNAGWEIGSHSVEHVDLTLLSDKDLSLNVSKSGAFLEEYLGIPIKTFSTPLGEFDGRVLNEIRKSYSSHVNAWSDRNGLNTKIGFYSYNVSRLDTANSTPDEICEQVSELPKDSLYILIFHSITEEPGAYFMNKESFQQIVDCVHAANVEVVSISESVSRMLSK